MNVSCFSCVIFFFFLVSFFHVSWALNTVELWFTLNHSFSKMLLPRFEKSGQGCQKKKKVFKIRIHPVLLESKYLLKSNENIQYLDGPPDSCISVTFVKLQYRGHWPKALTNPSERQIIQQEKLNSGSCQSESHSLLLFIKRLHHWIRSSLAVSGSNTGRL